MKSNNDVVTAIGEWNLVHNWFFEILYAAGGRQLVDLLCVGRWTKKK